MNKIDELLKEERSKRSFDMDAEMKCRTDEEKIEYLKEIVLVQHDTITLAKIHDRMHDDLVSELKKNSEYLRINAELKLKNIKEVFELSRFLWKLSVILSGVSLGITTICLIILLGMRIAL